MKSAKVAAFNFLTLAKIKWKKVSVSVYVGIIFSPVTSSPGKINPVYIHSFNINFILGPKVKRE